MNLCLMFEIERLRLPVLEFLMLCSFSASSMFFTVFIICYEFYEVLCNNLIGKKNRQFIIEG